MKTKCKGYTCFAASSVFIGQDKEAEAEEKEEAEEEEGGEGG
jgi:hypothetical protein